MILFLYDSYIVIILTILDQCIELIKTKLDNTFSLSNNKSTISLCNSFFFSEYK
jgi:hypothetical protein